MFRNLISNGYYASLCLSGICVVLLTYLGDTHLLYALVWEFHIVMFFFFFFFLRFFSFYLGTLHLPL
jgi:hypothetical protein